MAKKVEDAASVDELPPKEREIIHEHMSRIGRKGVRTLWKKILDRAEKGEPDIIKGVDKETVK